MNNRQTVFTSASENFRKYRSTTKDGYVDTVPAPGMPLPTWPNGRWCFEIAHYLDAGKPTLSTSSRGGSYSQIVYVLSHLTRYCYQNRIGFLELTDSQFTLFIKGLSAKSVGLDGTMREPRTTRRVVQIGRYCLGFLWYVGTFYGQPKFVAQDGTIRGFMKTYVVPKKGSGDKEKIRHYWHHNSFPRESPEKRRQPINDEYVSRLKGAVVKLSNSPFLRQRRFLMIRLLDSTGVRRIELVNLTVNAVFEAQDIAKLGRPPSIRVPTFKKRGGPVERIIPIDEITLSALRDYVEIYRAPIVDKVGFDCGFLLISVRGTKLVPNTVTSEVRDLRMAAKIEGKAHPHLFRHRFLCDRLVELMSAEDFKDTKSVIEHLLKAGATMTKLLEVSGHADVRSLELYINDAFMARRNEIKKFKNPEVSQLAASLHSKFEELTLMHGMVPTEELLRMALRSFEGYVAALSQIS